MKFDELLVKSNSEDIELEKLKRESISQKENLEQKIKELNTEIEKLKENNKELLEKNFDIEKRINELNPNLEKSSKDNQQNYSFELGEQYQDDDDIKSSKENDKDKKIKQLQSEIE